MTTWKSGTTWVSGIHWLIYGGESGPGYRQDDPQWAREVRDYCRAAGVKFFFKQRSGPRAGMGDLDGELIRAFPVSAEPTRPTPA